MSNQNVWKCVACGRVFPEYPTDKHCPVCKTRIRDKVIVESPPSMPENVSSGNVAEIDPTIKD